MEFFWDMAYSSRDGLGAGDPHIDPALLCVPTEGPTLETTVARVHLPVGPQPQLSTYEVSIADFS